MNNAQFSSLNLSDALLGNLATLGYTKMTPIQQQALPLVLAGDDLIGQAMTGSGKTAVFGLGLLSSLDISSYHVQALVICPTRELADQVATEIRRLARAIPNVKVLTVCGGIPLRPQAASLESGAQIVVGTPGRIEDHISKKSIDLKQVATLVLDEADRMLEMGFQPALDVIIAAIPKQRQTLLFSATFPTQIESISQRVMQQPRMVKIGASSNNSDIDQLFFKVENGGRIKAIHLLLLEYKPQSCVVFCNTKVETAEVTDQLNALGFTAISLHGDLEQRERDLVLIRFSNKSASILVATDVASRGLDIDDLDAVINYQVARELDVHTHRIGRTGRAGKSGTAFTLYSDQEKSKLELLAEQLNLKIHNENLPPKSVLQTVVERAPMITIQIAGGKKQKVRPGDILGALTGEDGIAASAVGKINIAHTSAYVAVERALIDDALAKLRNGKIKGKTFKVRSL